MKTQYVICLCIHPYVLMQVLWLHEKTPLVGPSAQRQEQLSTAQSQARIAKEAGTGVFGHHGRVQICGLNLVVPLQEIQQSYFTMPS